MRYAAPLFAAFLMCLIITSGFHPRPKLSATDSPQDTQIAQVETAIPAFVGYTQKAIYQKQNATRRAIEIKSFAEYEQVYGGPTAGFYLWPSVKLFFQNGGERCYIISVGPTTNPVQLAALERGLQISKQAAAQMLLIPDAVSLPTADFYRVEERMMQLCGESKDRFAILNTLAPGANARQDIKDFRAQISSTHLSRAAVYYPWLITEDEMTVPPCGALAGVYARTDKAQGVWKAPANQSLKGIKGLTNSLSRSDQEFANVSADGKSVNAIVNFTGKGILVWGARTLSGNDNEWRYVPVRRLAIMLENSLQQGLDWVVFEPNDQPLWMRVKAEVSAFVVRLWQQGALQGSKPEQAFFVKCGLGTTMTAQDILDGKLIIEIGFAPVRPAEFIVLRLQMQMKP